MIASGTAGTCPWELDSGGTLTVRPGDYDTIDASGHNDAVYLAIDKGLESLDVSKAVCLTRLDCSDNYYLSSIDVSKNGKLARLGCYYNNLAKLDISNNGKLTRLVCSNNKLTELDVSNNGKLTRLYCRSNKFTDSAKAKLKKWGKVPGHMLSI